MVSKRNTIKKIVSVKKKLGWKYYLICYFKKAKNDGISFKSVTLIKRTAKKKEVNISNILIEKVASVMINKKNTSATL